MHPSSGRAKGWLTLCYAIVLPGRKSACRSVAGLLPGKNRNRPSGQPSAGRRPPFSMGFPVIGGGLDPPKPMISGPNS